jgi:2-keto-4-pentenoate hydratase/2-oxohepta-3-ene-1,7-dioic acid hydratase in catechol pathway
LAIRCEVDGEVLQDSNTKAMVFSVAALISFLSQTMTLEPGDVLATGTPSGVGMGRTPQRWLRDGETVAIQIEGIGRLENPVQRPGP